jgi:hypothetical protein
MSLLGIDLGSLSFRAKPNTSFRFVPKTGTENGTTMNTKACQMGLGGMRSRSALDGSQLRYR